ncbi:MAG: response regulator [Proteobacteria bacterium]|nr:response regulator [Pseudomonadota bacterium]
MNLLLADDSSAIQKVITLSLQKSAYSVVVVSSFEDLKSELKRKSYALLICDGKLSGLRSAEMLKEVVQSYSSLKVLMLKGSYDGYDEQAFCDAGFDHVLAKPFSMADIASHVASLVPLTDHQHNHLPPTDSQLSRHGATAVADSSSASSFQVALREPDSRWQKAFEPYPGSHQVMTHQVRDYSKGSKNLKGQEQQQKKAREDLERYGLSEPSKDTREPHRDDVPSSADTSVPSLSSQALSSQALSSLDMDLIAAEVYSRLQAGIKKEIYHQLEVMVRGGVEKDIKELIREELQKLAEERSRL